MLPTAPPVHQEHQVTLLLTGGQQFTLKLTADNPLLLLLQHILAERALGLPDSVREVLQIPINDGRAALCFTVNDLVALVCEPPLIPALIQPERPALVQAQAPATLQSGPQLRVLEGKPHQEDATPARFVILEDFLPPKDSRALFDYVLRKKSSFKPTHTSTGAADYRRSLILPNFPEYADMMVQHIQKVMPQVLQELGVPPFPVRLIEPQLTAHNDGNYYKMHNDNGSPETADRELTFVYYFSRSPQPFTGGQLKIFDTRVVNNYYVNADSFSLVEPKNNTIVFFLARYLHEVLPVKVPSRAFMDSRFTVNGWVHR